MCTTWPCDCGPSDALDSYRHHSVSEPCQADAWVFCRDPARKAGCKRRGCRKGGSSRPLAAVVGALSSGWSHGSRPQNEAARWTYRASSALFRRAQNRDDADAAYPILDLKTYRRKATRSRWAFRSHRCALFLSRRRGGGAPGAAFQLPVTVTARGTDINLIPEYPTPRRMICEAAAQADGLITVCQALKDRLIELGAAPERITVLRNGVDLELFKPMDRDKARASLGLTRRTLGCVGWLIERKGHHHVIRALSALPDTDLLIVGEGPERQRWNDSRQRRRERSRAFPWPDRPKAIARNLQCDGRARARVQPRRLGQCASGIHGLRHAGGGLGRMGHARSDRRAGSGCVDEDTGCAGRDRGRDTPVRDPSDRAATRRYAEGFSWEATTAGQLALFRQILARRQPNNSP